MRRAPWIAGTHAVIIGTVLLPTAVSRGQSPTATTAPPSAAARGSLSLGRYPVQEAPSCAERADAYGAHSFENSWEISGPVLLRSADPEPPGEVVVKNILAWEHTKDSQHREARDSYEYELEIEWGVVENQELIF